VKGAMMAMRDAELAANGAPVLGAVARV